MKLPYFLCLLLLGSAIHSSLSMAQGGANGSTGPEKTSGRVDMGDFMIDQSEVSVGRFADYATRRQVVTAAEKEGGGFEYVMGWQKRPGWTWKTPFGKPAQPDEPAVHVNWFEAQAFC